jgi:hypothetical protein
MPVDDAGRSAVSDSSSTWVSTIVEHVLAVDRQAGGPPQTTAVHPAARLGGWRRAHPVVDDTRAAFMMGRYSFWNRKRIPL